ncbi:similar to glucose-methanol-choline oxidoreductase:GMC oxidoreductase [Botrytis cinerea T4]|uniref:Similar to glucose-methanol-choline oxidoreductase:GMC oxidoreductase n=1 Tax=Botryotinia fuckeliana (strain T4) TaxID=999810 RepID=G2YBD2_BOTF4|nr:similar to glucose-methanol-choline oxidoreductase:GMC oxidoreductase [Botrytis cinerea T4]
MYPSSVSHHSSPRDQQIIFRPFSTTYLAQKPTLYLDNNLVQQDFIPSKQILILINLKNDFYSRLWPFGFGFFARYWSRNDARAKVTNDVPSEVDYIVVGSGPGGGPLASRLALAGYEVLLIDAGDDQGDQILAEMPIFQFASTEIEAQQWDFFVHHYSDLERQKKDTKMTYQTTDGDYYVGLDPPADAEPLGVWYPRAGTLGGCSNHNAMISIYPHDSDWQHIVDITGDDSWAPDNMRTYFEKMEHCDYLPEDTPGHGFDGWLHTGATNQTMIVQDEKINSIVISAADAFSVNASDSTLVNAKGFDQVVSLDPNSPSSATNNATGLYQIPIAVDGRTRNGARNFILETANAVNTDGSQKYKLTLKLNTFVTKIRFSNDTTPRALGVDFLEGKSLYRADPRAGKNGTQGTPGSVNARKEVIISGGTYNSPQLLKLSGVGPKAELESFNIPVLVDLPGVGTNMQDRYETTLVSESDIPFSIAEGCTFLTTPDDPCLTQWRNDTTDAGLYATPGLPLAMIARSSTAGEDPDLLISGAPANFHGYYPGYSGPALGDALHWSWITLKAHARNTAGTVTLRSSNPLDTPLIQMHYFDEGTSTDDAWEKDLQAMYEGMSLSRQVMNSVVPLDGSFNETWPGADVSTEEELKEFIQDEAWGHHISCTNPIGADDDEMAVLDSSFRVRGTSGLRVVDASVFPKIPGFYIAVPIYMVSEKAAAVIIEQDAAGTSYR